jgi:hypothetical protein
MANRRLARVISGIAVASVIGLPFLARAAVTRGPYLQLGTPDAITVRWRTDRATDSRIRIGSAADRLDRVVDHAAATTEHEVRVTGLQPSTRYFYSVGSTTQTLTGGDPATFFETAPARGSSPATRVWVIGDSGTGNKTAAAVYNSYLDFADGGYTQLWLMLGDNAYAAGTDAQYQRSVFAVYPELLRQTVLWPALGNHEGKSSDSTTQKGPYFDIFTLPKSGEAGGTGSGTEAFYSYDYADIHFIVLDSFGTDRSAGGRMLTWLDADLQATRADWVVAYWHHPPYTKGSHDSDTEAALVEMRENALPILEKHGVDLVLTGHSHAYERSKFIQGHYGKSSTFNPELSVVLPGSGRLDDGGPYTKPAPGVTGKGTLYAVAGNAGHLGSGSLKHPAMFFSSREPGSMVLDFEGPALNAKFLNEKGALRDYFSIVKGPVVQRASVFQNGRDGYAGTEDSTVASGGPAAGAGDSPTLQAGVQKGAKGSRSAALLKWDVSSIPANATVTDAYLTLEVSDPSKSAYRIVAEDSAWSEVTATWANATSRGPRIAGLSAVSKGRVVIPLTGAGIALVQSWVQRSAPNHGLLLLDDGKSDGIVIRSSEAASTDQRPTLTVISR